MTGLSGSSPHLRGNHIRLAVSITSHGVIPAPAGEPYYATCKGFSAPGHPRTCGGTLNILISRPYVRGSSPHLRGNLGDDKSEPRPPRVIPAPAGEPQSQGDIQAGRGGHPRTCGGTPAGRRRASHPTGSSPHLRGNPVVIKGPISHGRVIPAPAGEPTLMI